MLRSLFPLLLAAALPASGQQGTSQPVSRPVLRALPLGTDTQLVARSSSAALSHSAGPQTAPLETVTPPSPLDAKPTGDDALRLQIFLDQANFGPGVIDGKPGRFTELAVYSWNEVNGYPVEDWVAVNTAARKQSPTRWLLPWCPMSSMTGWIPTCRPSPASKRRKSA